jgi:hydroxymethylglutaryl-CoA lyase
MSQALTLVECSRDAMQGYEHFIDTHTKIKYQNLLLQCGFDVLDFGSFVSPKAIPQMRDTDEVLNGLNIDNSKTELLAIIANLKGAQQASSFDQINVLGFPLSVSNTFQLRNTNKTIEESWFQLAEISNLCLKSNKKLVVYLSMGFGNPYGDPWNEDVLKEFIDRLTNNFNIDTIALSDTIGCASEDSVFKVFNSLIPDSTIELSAHLHVNPINAKSILSAAYKGGCRRFDGAIKGFGGCPMATDKLTGNMPTELILEWADDNKIGLNIDKKSFDKAFDFSSFVF